MANKFQLGNKVILRRHYNRTSKEILAAVRLDHPRTITAIFYDSKAEHTRYYLGTNKHGKMDLSDLHFRASQLKLWVKGGIGRTRAKRRYRRQLVVSQGV